MNLASEVIISSRDRRFSLEIKQFDDALAVVRFSATGEVEKCVTLVYSYQDFLDFRQLDPERFERHHEYERAALVIFHATS